eukprot:5731328-Pleurochrysis_carterae.AAC.1
MFIRLRALKFRHLAWSCDFTHTYHESSHDTRRSSGADAALATLNNAMRLNIPFAGTESMWLLPRVAV